MDVNKYLARIRVAETIGIDLKSLTMLQKAHLNTVPFENLDIHYGNQISLEFENIFKKIVVNERGGFCYELNSLFHGLLREIGFNARIVSARVASKKGGFSEEYDHLAIVVSIGGLDYLVDVGFGDFATTPLPIGSERQESDRVGEFQISKYDRNYHLVSKIEDEIAIPEYIFTMVERKIVEFHAMCEYHQNSESSHFTQKKVISILTNEGRITLTDTYLKITTSDGSQVTQIGSHEFDKYLKQYFNINI